MDKYDCHWVRWFAGDHFEWAITLGQTTYYSCSKETVDENPEWRAHEERHKQQWQFEGKLRFALNYIYYLIVCGYTNNPYEVDAREHAKRQTAS